MAQAIALPAKCGDLPLRYARVRMTKRIPGVCVGEFV